MTITFAASQCKLHNNIYLLLFFMVLFISPILPFFTNHLCSGAGILQTSRHLVGSHDDILDISCLPCRPRVQAVLSSSSSSSSSSHTSVGRDDDDEEDKEEEDGAKMLSSSSSSFSSSTFHGGRPYRLAIATNSPVVRLVQGRIPITNINPPSLSDPHPHPSSDDGESDYASGGGCLLLHGHSDIVLAVDSSPCG